ncbi:hypothetical protein ACWEAF_26350 [Streptomyces sp. NPDC005071]
MSRAAIVELLHAGHSDKAIARQLHVHCKKVRTVRSNLDLPAHKPGPTPSNPEEIFWRRTQPTNDGHLLWAGPGRQIRGGRNKVSVYQLAFHLRHHRVAVGNVTSGCGTAGCVHPDHVEDQPMRQQYAAIFGN